MFLFVKNFLFAVRQTKLLCTLIAISLAVLAYAVPSRLDDTGAVAGGILLAVMLWLLYVGTVGLCTAMYCAVTRMPVQAWTNSELNHNVSSLPRREQIKILSGSLAGLLVLIPLVAFIVFGVTALLQFIGFLR